MGRVKNFLGLTLHKFWVMWYLLKACKCLIWRGIIHDFSKYGKHEEPYFSTVDKNLSELVYGSDEYFKVLKEHLQPALDNHYANNSHHPEHYENEIDDMTLFDQIEMLCDWKAAGKRHKHGSMLRSIEFNQGRFKYDDSVKERYLNDSKELGMLDKGE